MINQAIDLLTDPTKFLIDGIVAVWPVLLVVFVWIVTNRLVDVYADKFVEGTSRKRRFKKIGNDSTYAETLHKIRTLHPREFEFYVADVLAKNGYKTKVVGNYGKPDGGVDIVARRKGEYYLVQCKKYIDSDVGVKHIREFYGIGADLKYKKQAKMIFVSTTYFTKAAKKFAKEKGIILVDADYLIALVFAQEGRGKEIEFNGFDRGEVMRQVPPACPVCTRQLVWRHGHENDFIGCSGYPQCKYVFSNSRVSAK